MNTKSAPSGPDTERRVFIDATMASIGGGFTYLVNLLPQLAGLAPRWKFRVALSSRKIFEALPAMPNVEIRMLEGNLARRMSYTFAGGPLEARRWKADLYFSVAETAAPFAASPIIASFRNLNVFERDHGWELATRWRLRVLHAMARLAARRSDGILFVSHDSARRLGDPIGLPESKRLVVHHGIDLDAWRKTTTRPERERPYVLSVSSIYRYKNYVRLIEAHAAVARRRGDVPDLVIIGEDRDPQYSARMERARQESGIADRIHLLGAMEYASVRRYYLGAELFVFPSHFETFGHPLLEGMASGVPVVASDMPVFREIAGDAVLYADPFDTHDLSRAIERALYDASLRSELVKRAKQRVEGFGWDASARRHLEIFERVIAASEASGTRTR